MPLFGNIVVIKRNGTDGISFPLTASSCLFGRRTECDIRIQLPQVSKEHCKIEVNENKEAVLTNLSTVNPTQLNGGCFQQPVPLKHGDVLTIIDRSFRFEYPLQSTPRKKRSRSPKDETLQQVAEVKLPHQQTSGSKSLHASDNADCEIKNANGNKQSTEEKISEALPVKLQTPKFSHRMHQSSKRQSQMSPFTKLYENLKHEINMKKSLQEGNVCQQATKDGKRISSSSCADGLRSLNKKELGRSEITEESKIKQEVIGSEFNQISALGSATKKSFARSPRTSVSKEISRDTGKSSHLQDPEELSTEGKSKGIEVTTESSMENYGNSALQPCSIECLDYGDRMKRYSFAIEAKKTAQTTHTTNISEVDKYVLSTPTSRRKSPRSHFITPTKKNSRVNPVNIGTPTAQRRVSLKQKFSTEISAETQREDSICRIDSLKELPLAENKCLKQRRNSKQLTPGKLVNEEVLKEICDQANFVNSKEEHSETPPFLSSSKSPRRNNRRSKELLNKSVHSETLASEELTSELASPASQKSGSRRQRGRPRTSGLLTEKAPETNAVQQHPDTDRQDNGAKEELATKEHQKQDLEDASLQRPCRLSSKRRSSGSATVLNDSETVSEMSVSGLLAGEESGKTKRVSQKRKGGDLLLQPLGKRKRVSFGGHLSPELFDKSLPPNSPVKRGAIPARLSLPSGNSPRAVLKKARGLEHFAVQELSEPPQKEKISPKRLLVQKSPAASPPASGTARPKLTSGSPAPYTKGRFSVSHITTPSPIAEGKDAAAEDMNTKEKNARVKTPTSSHVNQDGKTLLTAIPDKLTSAQPALKVTPMKRSGAVALINAKRRSGASSANLLVAKSWAEVVKLGVVRPQSKTVKKSVRKGNSVKKTTRSPKTPERKIKGHFSTGHAESPATIVVGKAYSTTVRTAGQVPKVVKNPIVNLNRNMDESFTGMTEMFQTPENKSGKTLPLTSVQMTDFTPPCTAVEISELHTPEESGEMMVSPLNSSDASEQKQDSPGICHLLREESLKSMFDTVSTKTPEKRKAMLEENISVDSLSIIPGKQASRLKSGSKRRTPKQKQEPVEVLSGIKQLMRTPKQKPEPVEVLSGIKQLIKTPKQKPEPVEVLSGIKQLMKTPKQKPEPVEVLSGIKQLMKTPKQKLEPDEVLSDIKQLMKTPKQKPEPVEVLSVIKQLMKTPKQKPEPVEVLSGIKQLMKTPKQKPEPVEVLSGIKQLMKTPKQKPEPVEVLSGIKQLMKTPKHKPEPVEVLSGIKQLMRTPKQKPEPVEVLSGIKQLMRTPKQKPEPVEVLSGIKQLMRTPKQKPEPVEVLSGIKQLMRTPKQKPEPVEVLSGIKQLMRTPKQKPEPVEVLSGIKQLMRTPKQKPEPVEVLSGIKQLMKTPQQELEPVTDEIGFKRLLKTPVQEGEAVKDVSSVTLIKKTPKLKYQPVEDMIGVSRIFKTPKKKVEPIEDMFGISRLLKTPREKYQPVDDFVGLQSLMAEPKNRCSDFEVDCVEVTEKFDIPEEIKVRSVNVSDSKQQDTAPPCTNSSQKYEDKGNISQGEDSQQKESISEDQSTQRATRGRSRNTVHTSSAKQCGKDLNVKELQRVEKKSTEEEMEEISTSASVAKNKGRGRRVNRCMQEEIVSKHPGQETVEVVSFVEPHGATQRPGRGKGKEQKELKHPSENLESCGRDSLVLREEHADTKQTLQEYGINDVLETEGDPAIKAVSVCSSIQNENCQLQTGLKKPENKPDQGGVDDSEEMLLSPRRRSRGVENTEPVIPPKRARRARNDQVKQASSEVLHGTTRKLRKDPSAKMIERDEQDKDSETTTAEESENGTKLETKVMEKRIKSLRSARKHSAEVKADICGMALENIRNAQRTEETSTETDTETQSHIKSEIKVSQGDETENAQANTTEASQRLKAESPSGETSKMPAPALNLESNRSAVQETNRTRKRRVREDSLEKKTDEFARNVNNLELITAKFKSETEMRESSLKDSLSSVCVKITCQVMKDQNSPAATPIPAANSDSLAHSRQKRTRNEQGILKPNQTEIPQENQAQENGTACRRGRGRKANFELEVSSKAVGGKSSLPGNDEGVIYKDGRCETSKNPLQVRRSRRKQVDSVPQIACSTFMENQTLIADHSKDEASVKEQDSALEATPSSTEDNPRRRGRRREVAAASQTSRSVSIRKRRGLTEGDDKKMTVREDQNPALGNKTLQAKANASARDKRKKIDLAVEAKSSSSLQRKCDLSETDDKEKGTNEKQNMPLETVSCAKEKPLGRGRRKETALTSHTTNYVSLRGKRGLPADNSREEAPKDLKVPLETYDSSVKKDQLRKGRKKEIALLLEATSSVSIQEKQDITKESGRKNNYREAKKLILEKSTSQEKMGLSKGNLRQTITSLAVSSTLVQGLPEDGKTETPEEKQSVLLEVAPSARENPPRVGRKNPISSKSEETSSTFLREKLALPIDRGQKRILKESKDTSLENKSSQEETRQLRSKRRKVEFTSEAANSTSSRKNGNLPENGNTLETQNVCLTSTGSEKNNQSGKEKEVNPLQQATSTSRRRKCQLPADDVASKKLKSEKDENKSLQKGKRNKAKEELGKEAVRATLTAGGMDRKTRSSTRTSARTRK
ncbi:proliferation marker protein Ki-67 isoform X3 [Tyto alba]|uniref:proliferation marker protein Ki-67 isoform X3 n=1 Tax=Tyto alba TaxID=56313 RepID=UPI001C6856D8|nr:proliferation marker protein Ki-67 isoform X3 [Tyto alba]